MQDSKGQSPLVVPKEGGFKGGNLRASNSELVSSLEKKGFKARLRKIFLYIPTFYFIQRNARYK